MDLPVWKQSITNKTEAIMKGTIWDKNRELPFYPDLIYRPPPRPTENDHKVQKVGQMLDPK